MENPHHWKFSLIFLGSFHNYKSFEDCTKIPCFIDDMNDVENCAKLNWDKEKMDGQSWPFNVTLHKIIQNSFF